MVTESPPPLTTLVECIHQFVLTMMMSPGSKVALISLSGHSHQHSGGDLRDLQFEIIPLSIKKLFRDLDVEAVPVFVIDKMSPIPNFICLATVSYDS